jgi:mRNA-degrading endonuclease RelE of RelBE toxin-antitoxin system
MKTYRVIVAPVAAKSIGECARYIAEVGGKPETAAKWVDRVYERIGSSEAFPQRHSLAEENNHREYEIRQQIFGNYVVLYSIDEEEATVHVVGFRQGQRLPRPEDLPERLGE